MKTRISDRAVFAVSALIVTLVGGCGGRTVSERMGNGINANPPPFLAGAPGMLFTNLEGFSAHLTTEPAMPTENKRPLSGTLVGQGGKLFFSPTRGGMSYIWDVAQHNGFTLSEPLQAYAPAKSTVVVTNIAERPDATAPGSETVNGHPCQRMRAILDLNDGSAARLTVWRAMDLHGLPVRIVSTDNPAQSVIDLHDARPENSSPRLFQPPDGFSKYADPEALVTELLSRQAASRGGVKRSTRPDDDLPPSDPSSNRRH